MVCRGTSAPGACSTSFFTGVCRAASLTYFHTSFPATFVSDFSPFLDMLSHGSYQYSPYIWPWPVVGQSWSCVEWLCWTWGKVLASSHRIQPRGSPTAKNLPSTPHTSTMKEYPSEKTPTQLGYAFPPFHSPVWHQSFLYGEAVFLEVKISFSCFFFFCLKAKKRSEKEKELVLFNRWVKYEHDQRLWVLRFLYGKDQRKRALFN